MEKATFEKIISSRRTIRKFLPDPVPDEDIKYIVNAARLAPSGENSQLWRFLAIRNKKVLAQMASAVDSRIKSFYYSIHDEKELKRLDKYKFFYLLFKDAPLVIAIIGRKPNTLFLDQYKEKYGIDCGYEELVDPIIMSFGAAAENMLLASTVLGYGFTWMTGPLRHVDVLENILKIDAPESIVSLIAIGKPYKQKKGPLKKTLSEVLSFLD